MAFPRVVLTGGPPHVGKSIVSYLFSAFLLTGIAWVIFRVVVRSAYRQKGRLTLVSSLLELLVWGLYMAFPCLYNPPEWAMFWSPNVPVGACARVVGLICIAVGMASAFGTMLWFGLRRAFGLQVKGLVQSGPYRVTRNPQLLGGSLLGIGIVVLWPSCYALGWVILGGIVAHTMVLTEEEHLRDVFGEEYERYCARVPRYLKII
jgi:protein-S-isoprenylcysteine O-methyltransferase Ste14